MPSNEPILSLIQAEERDRALAEQLNAPCWPPPSDAAGAPIDGLYHWEPSEYGFRRPLPLDDTFASNLAGAHDGQPYEPYEHLLRFPTCPSLATNRLRSHQRRIDALPSFHTIRVFTRGEHAAPNAKVYILHNGLNETEDLSFYYRLAANLVSDGSICILRPFPGHLSRHPFRSAFSQQPLDRYLADAGDLFRQFLRFMIESRWLLSAIAPSACYPVATGADLLLPKLQENSPAREEDAALAAAMAAEWQTLYKSTDLARSRGEAAQLPPPLRPNGGKERNSRAIAASSETAIHDSIHKLRMLLGEPKDEESGSTPTRSIHVMGYSLGGFVAQSVFFSWPYLIGSCATMLSGGPLRDIAPTVFADPEEWQTVVHALRYEQDDALMKQRIRLSRAKDAKSGAVNEIDEKRFELYQRIFYEVFEQQYRLPYQSRVAEFSRRLLFVVGGSDDIVKARSVMDAAPAKEGINLIEIANLSHFLTNPRGVEAKQQEFWLPEICRLIQRFSGQAEDVRDLECEGGKMGSSLDEPIVASKYGRNDLAEFLDRHAEEIPPDDRLVQQRMLEHLRFQPRPPTGEKGRLPSPLFERYLGSMIGGIRSSDEVKQQGTLFIAQNSVPAALLSTDWRLERAISLHHAEGEVLDYLIGLNTRRSALHAFRRSLRVIIPAQAREWHNSRDTRHPSKSETIPGLGPRSMNRLDQWDDIASEWATVTRFFDATKDGLFGVEPGDACLMPAVSRIRALESIAWEKAHPLEVSTLPDVWVWVADDLCREERPDPQGFQLLEAIRGDGMCKAFVRWVVSGSNGHPLTTTDVAAALDADQLRIVSLSGASYNPRYRGKEIRKPDKALQHLIHLALVVSHSGQIA